MVITLGQQYNVGEKPTVILYTYINRAGPTCKADKEVVGCAFGTQKQDAVKLFVVDVLLH